MGLVGSSDEPMMKRMASIAEDAARRTQRERGEFPFSNELRLKRDVRQSSSNSPTAATRFLPTRPTGRTSTFTSMRIGRDSSTTPVT